METELKIKVLKQIIKLIPKHIYICHCYKILMGCSAATGIIIRNHMKRNIPELYAEIYNEIKRTKPNITEQSISYPYQAINYTLETEIYDRIKLVEKVISNFKKNIKWKKNLEYKN